MRSVAAVAARAVTVLAVVLTGCEKEKTSPSPPPEAGAGTRPAAATRAGLPIADLATSQYALIGQVAEGVRVVKMTARKFQFEPARVVVRQGEDVRLEVTSTDVIHGLAIPAYGVNEMLEPKKATVVSFKADKPGRHEFYSSVFAGAGSEDMRGELLVLPPGR